MFPRTGLLNFILDLQSFSVVCISRWQQTRQSVFISRPATAGSSTSGAESCTRSVLRRQLEQCVRIGQLVLQFPTKAARLRTSTAAAELFYDSSFSSSKQHSASKFRWSDAVGISAPTSFNGPTATTTTTAAAAAVCE